MNRIEEIKAKMVPGAILRYGTVGDIAYMYTEDTKYLLAKLEIAEKALERYANLHKNMYDDAIHGELYEHWWLRQNAHAIEALKAIRE